MIEKKTERPEKKKNWSVTIILFQKQVQLFL